MKRLLTILPLLLTISALGQSFTTTNLTTGYSLISASSTSNAASTAIIPVYNVREVFVRVSFNLTNTSTSTSNITYNFGLSPYPSNLDTGNLLTLVVAANGSNTVRASTNFYIGSAMNFGLVSQVNSSTNTLGNNQVTVQLKDLVR